ncbi:MAG: hypothetical protein AAF684_00865, partial [Pseudomonadota bacterium]
MTQTDFDRGDARVAAYARWIIRWRWLVLAASLFAAAAAAYGAQFLSFSTDYRVFFSDSNPQLEAFERVQRVYTKDDNVMFVIKPAGGDVFTRDV